MHPVLRDVAAALGDKARVIKIDIEKNTEFYQQAQSLLRELPN